MLFICILILLLSASILSMVSILLNLLKLLLWTNVAHSYFSTYKILCHLLLASVVSSETSATFLIVVSLEVIHHFSLAVFKDFLRRCPGSVVWSGCQGQENKHPCHYHSQSSPGPPSLPHCALRCQALQLPACSELGHGASGAMSSPPAQPALPPVATSTPSAQRAHV